MRKMLNTLTIALIFILTGSPVSAAITTTFNNADPADSYLSTPGNWDHGLPVGFEGIITTNANCGFMTLTNFVVTQIAGDISNGPFPYTGFTLNGGSWTMDGGSITCRAHTYSGGAVFTLNNGALTTANNSHITIQDSASQLIVNGGTINLDRNMYLKGGTFTINGGTIIQDTADTFGAPAWGSGTMNFNGGTITAGRFAFQVATFANFGGTTAGNVSFIDWGSGNYTSTGDRQRDDQIRIDFSPGVLMTMTMNTGARALDLTNDSTDNPTALPWPEALWNAGQLTYNGAGYTTLGTWAAVTSAGFGDGYAFAYNSGTGTLSLVKTALVGLFIVN